MPTIAVEKGAHSADKDHVVMTGGTLTWDKTIHSDAPLFLHQYLLPVAPVEHTPAFFAGIHSMEHALAYTPETGSLRSSLAAMSGNVANADRLVDVSPYIRNLESSTPSMAFRATFVSNGEGIAAGAMLDSYRNSLKRMRAYYELGGEPPFSTPLECGQYDLHSAREALRLIALAEVALQQADASHTGGEPQPTDATELFVCDLRLVKPRARGNKEQRVLDLMAGHLISQTIEQKAGGYLSPDRPNPIRTGNFGCSTGEYLILANPANTPRQEYLGAAHLAIAHTLADMAAVDHGSELQLQAASDARFCLEHIQQFSPSVYSQL